MDAGAGAEAVRGWSAADLRALLERYKVPCDDCDRWASASGVAADHAATLFAKPVKLRRRD